ncbi:B-cell receptor CD22-like [Polymixia lowei]
MISSSISSNQVKLSNTIKLTCTADAHPIPLEYTWYRCSENVSSSPWNAKTTNQNSLCLQTVERTDGGCYVCSATNTIGKGENSSSLYIQVLYAPTKPVLSVGPEAREGDLITIDCTVESFPLSALTLTWTPETDPRSPPRQLAPSGYGPQRLNSIQVSFNVTSNSAGLYTCHAWNPEGSSHTVKELVVKYSPKNVTVQAKPDVVMIENGELVLNCLARSNPLATSYTWMKNTTGKVEVVGHDHTFTVKSLTPSHSGLYSCKVSNDIGTGKSAEFEVKVKYAPKHTEITQMSSSQFDSSSPVVLSCSSLSVPPVSQYRWFRTTDQVPETFFSENQSITIHPHQPGAYYCVASNEIAGKRSATINVVFYRGFMQALPFIIRFLIALTIILLIFLVYRHKRNKSKQGTSNTLSCCFGFLVLNLFYYILYPLSASNINTVDYEVNLPMEELEVYENIISENNSMVQSRMLGVPTNSDTENGEEDIELNY